MPRKKKKKTKKKNKVNYRTIFKFIFTFFFSMKNQAFVIAVPVHTRCSNPAGSILFKVSHHRSPTAIAAVVQLASSFRIREQTTSMYDLRAHRFPKVGCENEKMPYFTLRRWGRMVNRNRTLWSPSRKSNVSHTEQLVHNCTRHIHTIRNGLMDEVVSTTSWKWQLPAG